MQRILLVADNQNDITQLADLMENRYELMVANGRQTATKLAAEKGLSLIHI